MAKSADRLVVTRVLRPGQADPPHDEWLDRSPEERIEAVWELTKICLDTGWFR